MLNDKITRQQLMDILQKLMDELDDGRHGDAFHEKGMRFERHSTALDLPTMTYTHFSLIIAATSDQDPAVRRREEFGHVAK